MPALLRLDHSDLCFLHRLQCFILLHLHFFFIFNNLVQNLYHLFIWPSNWLKISPFIFQSSSFFYALTSLLDRLLVMFYNSFTSPLLVASSAVWASSSSSLGCPYSSFYSVSKFSQQNRIIFICTHCIQLPLLPPQCHCGEQTTKDNSDANLTTKSFLSEIFAITKVNSYG